jgi:stress response protein SCP2
MTDWMTSLLYYCTTVPIEGQLTHSYDKETREGDKDAKVINGRKVLENDINIQKKIFIF